MGIDFRPMLACSESAHNYFDALTFPLLASTKIDGIRATVRGGVVYARSNKPFPNPHLQAKFKHLENFDGELILGDPTSQSCCRDTGGVTNSHDKPVDRISFFVFDHVGSPASPYKFRHEQLDCISAADAHVHVVDQVIVKNLEDLLEFEEEVLEQGYEGLILRDPNAPYKCGRSTDNEQYLLKLKRFTDAEFEVIGFEERMKNNNVKTVNELGRGTRSSHKENKEGRGDLGALVLKYSGGEFRCGTGFSDSERAAIWSNQDAYMGRLAKVKYFAIGMKSAPRHPTFLSWRDRDDL